MSTLMSTIRMMSESAPAAKTNTVLDEAFEALIALEEEVEFDMNEAFEALDENLRSDIAKVSSKYPEGSSVKVKGKSVKVVSHGKDFLVVSAGKGTMNVNLKDVVKKESVDEALSPSYKNKYIGKDKASLQKTRNSFLSQIDDLIKFKKKTTKDSEVVKLQDLLKQVDHALKGVNESKKPVSQMTPKEKAEHDKKRKEYNAYQKSKRNENIEEGAEVYTMKKGSYTRQVDGKEADKMKKQGWKLVGRVEKFPTNTSATQGKRMGEGVEEANMGKDAVDLEEHIRINAQNTIKGNRYDMNTNSYGLTASLIAAVNDVVTGVEPSPAPAEAVNEIIENGPVDMQEATHEGLDKVNPTAVKKKFANRKDKDIDNDGDVDSSDEYLHKKRKAISKSMDEASIKEFKADGEDSETADPTDVKAKKPKKGKKDGDEEKKGGEKIEINPKLDEAPEMTDAQMKKREEIILSMKDKTPEFKKKYGDRWEDVMYATATKLAMK